MACSQIAARGRWTKLALVADDSRTRSSIQHHEIVRSDTSTLLAQFTPTPGGFAASHASTALMHALA